MKPFEKRVPKELWAFVRNMGYHNVPAGRRKAWLQEHFFLPSGWPECRNVAYIKSISRTHKFCWQALSDVVAFDVPTLKRGRPKTSMRRHQTLYCLLHKETSVPAQWQWPLIGLILNSTKLVPAERLWLMGRAGVLPAVFARLFCLELAIFCADLTGLHQGYTDEACDIIKTAQTAGTVSVTSVRRQLITALPKHSATLVFLEVLGGLPAMSVRRTLAEAARVCIEMKLQNMQEVFANMLRPVIMERSE